MVYLRNYAYHLAFIFLIYSQIFSCDVYSAVTINEIVVQPNQIVELYNSASTSADISSWYIDDSGGSTYFTIPINTILPPQSCLVFSSDFNFNKSSPDMVRLFDNTDIPTSSSAHLIEQYSYVKGPDINFSFSKTNDGGDEWIIYTSSPGLSNTLLTSCIPTPTSLPPTTVPTIIMFYTPTPTSEQIEPTLTQPATLENIFISELYPYPLANEHEWIELYNDNSYQVDLSKWYIDDGESTGSIPKVLALTMDPHSYGIFEISTSLFNNSGDIVRLLDNEKSEVDSFEYEDIEQGKSIGRISIFEDIFCEQVPSKNNKNMPCSVEPTLRKIPTDKYIVRIPTIFQVSKKIVSVPSKTAMRPISEKDSFPLPHKDVLGVSIERTAPISAISLLSLVSVSHSLLTIVSIFIKMKNAQV